MDKFRKLLFFKFIELICVVVCVILIFAGQSDIFVPVAVVLLVLGMILDIYLFVYLLGVKK